MGGRAVPKVFYVLAGRFSKANAQRFADGSWNLTGHVAGEPVEGVTYLGPDADARCFHAAKRMAWADEIPRPSVSRVLTRSGLQPVTIWRKAV